MSTPQEMPSAPSGPVIARAIVIAGVLLGSALLLAALGLWFHYGTVVFLDMIKSGIAACF